MKNTILVFCSFLITGSTFGQQVGINTDGSAPQVMLHVKANAASDGIRIENIAGNGDPIVQYTLNGTTQFTMGVDDSDADKWKLDNGTVLDATPYVSVETDGQVGINTNAPAAGDMFTSTANATHTFAINGYSANANGAAVYGFIATAGSLWGALQGESFGDYGVSGTGDQRGVIGEGTTITTTGFGGQFTNDGVQANVGGWQCCWTARKIWGGGSVSTIVDGNDEGTKVTMTAAESPDILFTDYGSAELVNGEAVVQIDPILTNNIHVDENHPIRIFIQPEGECKGLYVSSKSADSFSVKELMNGQSNIAFSYTIVAHRANEIYEYSDGSIKVSNNINARFQKVDESFYLEHHNRNIEQGRRVIRVYSEPIQD